MANTIVFFSNDDGDPHSVRIFNEAGAQQGGLIVATAGAVDTFKFVFTVPVLAAGFYSYAAYKDGTKLRSNGEFYWNGTDIVHTEATELTQAQAQAAVAAALTAYDVASGADILALEDISAADVLAQVTGGLTSFDAATAGDVTAAQVVIIAAIAALNNVSTAQIEAALLDDGDGQAFRAGLAATIEAALANEADGNATVAVFQGAVAAALTAYDAATGTDVSTAETNIIAALPTPSDATAANQTQILADIAALNDISTGDVLTQAASALATYDGPTEAELAQAVIDITNVINAGQGLTPAQAAVLTFLRDVAEADEVYGPLKAQKLLKGTTTVLVDKDVTTTTECNVNTQLIEAP